MERSRIHNVLEYYIRWLVDSQWVYKYLWPHPTMTNYIIVWFWDGMVWYGMVWYGMVLPYTNTIPYTIPTTHHTPHRTPHHTRNLRSFPLLVIPREVRASVRSTPFGRNHFRKLNLHGRCLRFTEWIVKEPKTNLQKTSWWTNSPDWTTIP